MRRTRKSFRGRKSRKLKRRSRRVHSVRSKVRRGGDGGIKPYSAGANYDVEGVGGNFKSLPLQYKGGRRSRVRRGGSGVTSFSIYSQAKMPQSAFKSLPAEFPVSTTRKELGGYFPFERIGLKY